jgi:tetratricopeptide (TPR) repeat protein
VPPELLGFFDNARAADLYSVDMWCLGETVFRALVGESAFKSQAELGDYSRGYFQFPKNILERLQVSETAISFLSSLIVPDPKKRLTAESASAHPWIEAQTSSVDPEPEDAVTQSKFSNVECIRSTPPSVSSQTNNARSTTLPPSDYDLPSGDTGDRMTQASGSWTTTLALGDACSPSLNISKAEPEEQDVALAANNALDEKTSKHDSESSERPLDETVPGQSEFDYAQKLHKQELYEEAEEIFRKVLGTRTQAFGREDSRTTEAMIRLIQTQAKQKKYDEVESSYRELLALKTKVWGKDHENTVAIMFCLAATLSVRHKYGESDFLFREVIELRTRDLGKEHKLTLLSLYIFASSLLQQRRYNDADLIFSDVIKLRTRVLGKEHPDTLRSMSSSACSLTLQGKLKKAKPIYQEVVKARTKTFGKEHKETLQSMKSLAWLLFRLGDRQKARDMYKEVAAVQGKVLGSSDPETLRSVRMVRRTNLWTYWSFRRWLN